MNKKIIKCISVIAYIMSNLNISTACMFWIHQEAIPDKVKQLKK